MEVVIDVPWKRPDVTSMEVDEATPIEVDFRGASMEVNVFLGCSTDPVEAFALLSWKCVHVLPWN